MLEIAGQSSERGQAIHPELQILSVWKCSGFRRQASHSPQRGRPTRCQHRVEQPRESVAMTGRRRLRQQRERESFDHLPHKPVHVRRSLFPRHRQNLHIRHIAGGTLQHDGENAQLDGGRLFDKRLFLTRNLQCDAVSVGQIEQQGHARFAANGAAHHALQLVPTLEDKNK